MINEFCLQTGTDEDAVRERWTRCQELIIKYAPLEQKKAVKALLRDMTLVDEENDGMTCSMVLYNKLYIVLCTLEQLAFFAILLLVAFLNGRSKSQTLLTVIEVS